MAWGTFSLPELSLLVLTLELLVSNEIVCIWGRAGIL